MITDPANLTELSQLEPSTMSDVPNHRLFIVVVLARRVRALQTEHRSSGFIYTCLNADEAKGKAYTEFSSLFPEHDIVGMDPVEVTDYALDFARLKGTCGE